MQKAADVAEEIFWGALIASVPVSIWFWYEGWRGAPLYIALGAFVALGTTVIAASVLRYFKRRANSGLTAKEPTALAAIQLSERVEELEREKVALEKAREGASELYEKARNENDTLQMVITSRIKELESYKWVHDIANRDKSNIGRYVYIIFRNVRYEGLDEIESHIEIVFNIINASVYNIIIDKDIENGAVYFNDLELNPKQAKLDGSLHSISRDDRGEVRVLIIKQWVSPELAKRIKNPQPNDKLSFNRLWLNVRAANNSEIKPQRLSLPPEIPVEIQTDLKPEIEGLNKQVAALEAARKEDAKRINDEVNNNANTYKYLETVKSNLRAVTTERDSLKSEIATQREKHAKEIEDCKEQLKPKIDILFESKQPYQVYTPNEGEIMTLPGHTFGQIDINVEIKNRTEAIISNVTVEIAEVRQGHDKPNMRLRLPPPRFLLRQMDGNQHEVTLDPEGHAFFNAARKEANEPGLTLFSANHDDPAKVPYFTEGMELVLVASGSNTLPCRKRLRVTASRHGRGYVSFALLDD